MKTKNLVYWGGLLILLLGTVWAAANAGPAVQMPTLAVDKVAGLWPAGIDAPPRPCPDVMCPDGSPRDEFCRCQPRACIDLMCPDGSPRDEFCRCQPRACIDLMCPDGSPRDEFCRCPICTHSECTRVPANDAAPATLAADKLASPWLASIGEQARICIDQMCPDGSPRDEFCRCRPTVCTDRTCSGGSPW